MTRHYHVWSMVDRTHEECVECGVINPISSRSKPHPDPVPDCECGRGLALYIWDDLVGAVCSRCFDDRLAYAHREGAA